VAALRKKVDAAISEEDAMQQQLETLQGQAASLSQQADNALRGGDEPNARLLIQQQQRAEQRATMLQADLDQHKHATSDLIEHVNVLDAVLSDKRREQTAASQTASAEAAPQSEPESSATSASLSTMLREARIQRQDSAAASTVPPAVSDSD